jgi:5'-3' exonuclease
MGYIRLAHAQPNYNPNVRHCLYRLDADLIMLGLLSHDPLFWLLSEEVKFGGGEYPISFPSIPNITNVYSSLESQIFYLLPVVSP